MGGIVSKSSNANSIEIRHTKIKEGEKIPIVKIKGRLRHREGDDVDCTVWKEVTTEDLFKGKRIVMFSVPGAFTPVCSCDHLPGYQAKYHEVLKQGVDDVYCISVNDAFVMRQWGFVQCMKEETRLDYAYDFPLNPGNFSEVKLIPDGSSRFTSAMGMACKFEEVGGLGERSWRYSAVINDCIIEKMFLEEDGQIHDDNKSDPLKVSDVNTMLEYLAKAPATKAALTAQQEKQKKAAAGDIKTVNTTASKEKNSSEEEKQAAVAALTTSNTAQ